MMSPQIINTFCTKVTDLRTFVDTWKESAVKEKTLLQIDIVLWVCACYLSDPTPEHSLTTAHVIRQFCVFCTRFETLLDTVITS